MYIQNSVKFHQFVLKLLSGNKILTLIKGHNSIIHLRKLLCNNPNLDLVNINVYPKFGQIPSICSKAIQQKQNSDKTHGSSRAITDTLSWKLTCNNPNLDLVNINAYAKFGRTPSIRSQDIEWKWNSDNNHGSSRAITLVTIWWKVTRNNPNLDLININVKFGQIPSICSQDIERKWIRNHGMMENLKTVYPTPILRMRGV